MPLRMVWLSGLWRIIGGGDQVVVSIALVMVADIFSEEERYRSDLPSWYFAWSDCFADRRLSFVSSPA